MIVNPLSKDNSLLRPAASSNTAEVTQLIARHSPFAATDGDSSSSPYASSMDNISRLLNGFMKSSPPQNDAADIKPSATEVNPLLSSFNQYHMAGGTTLPAFNDMLPSPPPQQPALMGHRGYDEPKQQHQQGPLSPIEKWLFEEAAEQVVDLMDLSSDGCCSVPMMF
ncbi:transcription factor MYB30-like [Panicum miliaceum]|nr:transcription factor MYB30-like [Panicum miliaceum]